MVATHPLALIAATVAAFVVSGMWYSPFLFGNAWAGLREKSAKPKPRTRATAREVLQELAKTLVVAIVIAHFVARQGAAGWTGAVSLALWLWVGFYATLLGSVIHESYPWRLYAIHAGDGLVRTLIMTMILAVWR